MQEILVITLQRHLVFVWMIIFWGITEDELQDALYSRARSYYY